MGSRVGIAEGIGVKDAEHQKHLVDEPRQGFT